MQLMSVVW